MWLPQFRQEQSWKWLMSCCPVSLQHDDYTHQRGMRVSLFIKIDRMSSNQCCQLCPGNQSLFNFIVMIILQWNGTFLVNLQNSVNPVKFVKIPDMTWKIPELPKVPLCFGSAESVCVSLTWSLRVHCSVHMSVMRLRACLAISSRNMLQRDKLRSPMWCLCREEQTKRH